MSRLLRLAPAVGGLAFGLATSAGAQGAPAAGLTPADAPSRRDTTAAPRPHLLSRGEVRTLGAFALGAAAAAPFDRRITAAARRPALHRGGALPATMDVFRVLGDPGSLVLAGGTYVVGRLAHRPGVADFGLHTTEAVVASGVITTVLKLAVGRARPYAVGDADAARFRPGRGTGAFTSFPSGHTTAAFAVAAAGSAELGRPEVAARHPLAARLAPPLLYSAAALTGISRVYHDKHWASDVLAGAAVGTVAGHALVRFQHGRPPGRIERMLLPVTIAPTPWGTVVGWRLAMR